LYVKCNTSIPGILAIHYQGDVEIKPERNEVGKYGTSKN